MISDVENKVLITLNKHPKEYTSSLFRITRARLSGYDVESFRFLLHDMRKRGLIKYVSETEFSLPFWEIV